MSKLFPKPTILEQIGTTHCAIEASAGTGKTYLLENLVLDLIMQGVHLGKILVVTFTTKATIELKARIRARIENIILNVEDPQTIEPYAIDGPTWEVNEITYRLLKDSLANFDKINISTIHSFCQQTMSDSAFESGQLFKQKVIYGDHTFKHVFKKFLRKQLAKNEVEQIFLSRALKFMGGVDNLHSLLLAATKEKIYLDLPNLKALAAILENFPITATKDYIEEVKNYRNNHTASKYLCGPIMQSLKASSIDTVSYKAIGNKLEKLLNGINTYKKYCVSNLFWSEITPLEVYYLQEKFAQYIENRNNDTLIGLSAIASACKDLASNAYDFKAVIVATMLPTLIEELTEFKYNEGLIDFDDMILIVNQVINSRQGEPVVQRLRDRFQVALIDEFQDTDRLQWEIFKKVFLDSQNHRLILVGDPKQAIYGFRGGDLQTYTTAIDSIKTITGKKAKDLIINFRSSPELIAAQCNIFQGHEELSFFTGKNATLFKRPTCGKPELKLQDGQNKTIPPIHIIEVNQKNTLSIRKCAARGIALAIKEALLLYRFENHPIKPEHIMVLTTSAREGREMARALKSVGVPHTFFRQDGLFITSEAKALLDLLLAIDNPNDIAKRAKALLGPFFNFSFEEVEQCRQLSDSHPILKYLLDWQRLALSGQYGQFFTNIISDSGITQRLLFLENDKRSLTNILHLLELLQKETITGYHTPLDLAIKVKQWINGLSRPSVEDSDIQRLDELTGAVQILTIHKAKGLEAPIVAVYGGFSRNIARTYVHRYHNNQGQRKIWIGSLKFAPMRVQISTNTEQYEEQQRLLYVALTRSKAQLILPKIMCDNEHENGNNGTSRKAFNRSNGVYHCVNQQLPSLPNELVTYSTTTSCDNKEISKQTINNVTKQINICNGNLPKLTLPKFSDLTNIGRPIREFSSIPIKSYPKNLACQNGNDWQVDIYNDSQTYNSSSDHQTYKNNNQLESTIYKLLQLLPLNVTDKQPIDSWLKKPTVASLFENETPSDSRKNIATLTHKILTCKLKLPTGKTITISKIRQMIRNLDFTTIYPGHNDLLIGSIDMVFQWNRKIYILDWKIDQLESYCNASLQTIIKREYLMQARIYIMATCRFLDITSEKLFQEKFGGLIYAFIGGLPNEGMWTLKPSWNEMQDWELKLKNASI
jgi:exodeoxyribonuclease V beta subunit